MQHKPCSGSLQSWVGVAHQVLLAYVPQINKSCWVPPSFLPDCTHLGSLNTRIFLLIQPGTHFQMMRPTPCFMLRWSLRSSICCYNTQMSSAKVFKKTDLPGLNFDHQWPVLCHHSFSPANACDLSHFASPSKLLQISAVKNIFFFFISPHWGSSFSSRFRGWASHWNSRQEIHPLVWVHTPVHHLTRIMIAALLHFLCYLAIYKHSWETNARMLYGCLFTPSFSLASRIHLKLKKKKTQHNKL